MTVQIKTIRYGIGDTDRYNDTSDEFMNELDLNTVFGEAMTPFYSLVALRAYSRSFGFTLAHSVAYSMTQQDSSHRGQYMNISKQSSYF